MSARRRRQRVHRLPAIVGWILAAVGAVGYAVNEFSADIPAVHYGLVAVMLSDAWLGLRHLR